MIKYIDLSYEIKSDMPFHPYDEAARFYQDKFIEKDQYNNSKLEIGMHVGTHMDAPSHLMKNGKQLHEFPLDKFLGRGCLLDVRGQNPIVMRAEFENLVKKDDIVLLYTGNDEKYGTDSYYHGHPVIDQEFAEFLCAKRIKMVGMDLPSPDDHPFEIHNTFFKNDILIIENMTNLGQLKEINAFEVIALPLKIEAEASIVRAIARCY